MSTKITEIISSGGWHRTWVAVPTDSDYPARDAVYVEAFRRATGEWDVYRSYPAGLSRLRATRDNLRGARMFAVGGNGRLYGRHTSITEVVTL